MPTYNKKISETAIRLGEVRFGYVNVFAPRMKDDGTTGKYSVQILIPKDDAVAKRIIDAAVAAAAQNGVTSKFGGKLPRNLKTPLRDGDDEFPEDDTYKGMWFMNASSTTKPGVLVLDNGELVDALDGDDFYSGCYGCAAVNFFPYNTSGNLGVACGLNNVIKTRDGDKLSGGHSAREDFADLASELASFLK